MNVFSAQQFLSQLLQMPICGASTVTEAYVGPQLLLSKIEAYICGASTVCAISLHALIAPLINGGTFNYISRLSPMKIN